MGGPDSTRRGAAGPTSVRSTVRDRNESSTTDSRVATRYKNRDATLASYSGTSGIDGTAEGHSGDVRGHRSQSSCPSAKTVGRYKAGKGRDTDHNPRFPQIRPVTRYKAGAEASQSENASKASNGSTAEVKAHQPVARSAEERMAAESLPGWK